LDWKSIAKEFAIVTVAVVVGLAVFYYFSIDQQVMKAKTPSK